MGEQKKEKTTRRRMRRRRIMVYCEDVLIKREWVTARWTVIGDHSVLPGRWVCWGCHTTNDTLSSFDSIPAEYFCSFAG